MKHGIESLRSLARWVAATAARDETAGVIDSLEVANEPGLNTRGLQAVILAFTREAVLVARGELPRASGVKLVLNFIQPNDEQVASWLGSWLGLGLGLLTLTVTVTVTLTLALTLTLTLTLNLTLTRWAGTSSSARAPSPR